MDRFLQGNNTDFGGFDLTVAPTDARRQFCLALALIVSVAIAAAFLMSTADVGATRTAKRPAEHGQVVVDGRALMMKPTAAVADGFSATVAQRRAPI